MGTQDLGTDNRVWSGGSIGALSYAASAGGLKHAVCERNVFVEGHFVVVPSDITRVTESTGQSVDLGHRGMKRKAGKIELRRENIPIT